jgi:histidine triad (HIT) family protein
MSAAVPSMKHAPPGYDCPFCRIAATLESPAQDPAVVLIERRVFAVVPLHSYGNIRGNCLVVPRSHHENLLDTPPDFGADIQRASRKLALAMQTALGCEGISTRQHNGPAGDQDVWHFHQHVIPRYSGDELWKGHKQVYAEQERLELAARLRAAVGERS